MLTLMNMLSGILSIYIGMMGNLELAAYLIFIAAIFDFSDGFAARLLNATSEIGKQLDSLADVVSFGVAPGFILFGLISQSIETNTFEFAYVLPFFGFLVPLFGALRLAKFNVDENQQSSFIGMPTPAVAILIASFPLINNSIVDFSFVSNSYFLITTAIVASYLMLAPLPMFALKFKSYGWKENKIIYSFLLVSLALLIWLQFAAIPIVITLYVLLSVVIYLMDTKN